jgi:hypothetical protein
MFASMKGMKGTKLFISKLLHNDKEKNCFLNEETVCVSADIFWLLQFVPKVWSGKIEIA